MGAGGPVATCRSRSPWLIGLAAAAAVVISAAAQESLRFDIPAGQPLSEAIEAFSRVSRVQVIYASELVFGRQSPGVQGRFPAETALEALIAGTGLVVRFTRADAVTLVRPTPTALAVPPGSALPAPDLVLAPLRIERDETDQNRFRAYMTVLRNDVERALKSNAKTRANERYSVSLRLWVAPNRAIQRLELVRPTGDNDRDAAISRALQGLVVSEPPPPRMPNPALLAIHVRPL